MPIWIRKASSLFVLASLFIICGCHGSNCNCYYTTELSKESGRQNGPSLKSGESFNFGRYEQDNDLTNGIESIEWIVLAVEKDRALMITRYALDVKPYNEEYNNVTWQTSSLRKWLNNDFYNDVFSTEEKNCIAEVKNNNPKNPSSGTRGGLTTKDRIFLLSNDEAAKYFINDESRQCEATEFAKANGAYLGKNGKSWWWLRSSGSIGRAAAVVLYTGYVTNLGFNVENSSLMVRPAVWIYI